MKKRTALFAVSIMIILQIAIGCSKTEPMQTVNELLSLGEEYLLELDYDQAAVQFLKVVEIEPMNPRGYTGLAEAYMGLRDIDNAISALQLGLEALPNEQSIIMLLDELVYEQESENLVLEESQKEEDRIEEERQEELALEAEALLADFAVLISVGNPDAAAERMRSELDGIANELANFNKLPYIINTEHGRIGIYQAIGLGGAQKFWIYHGGYSGDSREGYGVWIESGSIAEGTWAEDAPNGFFEQRSTSQPWKSVGNVVNGLWDGERVTTAGGTDGNGDDVVHIMQLTMAGQFPTEHMMTVEGLSANPLLEMKI